MYKIVLCPFKTLLKRILWFIDVGFVYMHIYTCARKQKKRQKKYRSRELFRSVLFFWQKAKKKRELIAPPLVPFF